MGIKYTIECNKCETKIEKEISKEGNVFLGIAENGFVIRATETFPFGWKGVKGDRILCRYCLEGKERSLNTVTVKCQKCKKVEILITLGGKNLNEDIDEEIRRVAILYEFEEYEPGKFNCVECKKEVKSEKTNSNSSSTPR
jgi:Zn finger protein HypA/HybF involved in hydrogenase expression